MSDYHIRHYKDSDYAAVRDIFACGIREHCPAALCHTLRLPRVWILILAVFLLTLVITGSSTVSVIAAVSVVLTLLLIIRNILFTYFRVSLAGDLLDIKKNYLQRDGCCFWVAESGGEIVGTVAAAPHSHPDGQNQVELKRLSVPKKHRRKGIAKALVKRVMEFAQKSGYRAIVLDTSLFQMASVHLYTSLGFRIQATIYNNVLTRFIDFYDVIFQYDL